MSLYVWPLMYAALPASLLDVSLHWCASDRSAMFQSSHIVLFFLIMSPHRLAGFYEQSCSKHAGHTCALFAHRLLLVVTLAPLLLWQSILSAAAMSKCCLDGWEDHELQLTLFMSLLADALTSTAPGHITPHALTYTHIQACTGASIRASADSSDTAQGAANDPQHAWQICFFGCYIAKQHDLNWPCRHVMQWHIWSEASRCVQRKCKATIPQRPL